MLVAILRICIVALLFFTGSDYAFSSFKLPYISFGEKEEKPGNNPDKSGAGSEIAQSPFDLSQPFTLKQCVQIALEKSPGMKTAKFSLIQEELNVQDAKSSYSPAVDVSGRYMFSDAIDFGWEKENYDASIAAGYVIWDHGQRKSALAQAKTRKDVEYSRYNKTRQSLIFDIISGYYTLLEAEKLIDVDKQLLEQSKQNVEKIKAFMEKGAAIEADVATARVQQANNELTIINDLNNMDIARANLSVLMGLDPGAQINVVDDPDYDRYMQTGIIETEEILIEDIKSRALANRPEITELKYNKTILELAANLAKLERWPKINAESHYNVMLDDYLRERDAFKNHKSWDVLARVTFPLFDDGRSRRTVQKAEIALYKVDENMIELEKNIALEVHQSYFNFERSKKLLDISRIQVEDAKMSMDVAQGRYDQDMIILLELLDAQSRYGKALTNQVKVFYDYKVARKSLEKAMGVLQ